MEPGDPTSRGCCSEMRGRGLVMVGASFLLHMLTVGLSFSFGGLYVAWQREFQQSKAMTSLVVSVQVTVMFALGPVTSVLLRIFGNRTIQVTGALLSCAGFSLSYLVTSLTQLILCLGAVAGVGFSFNYIPAVTMLAEYFTRTRALAYGLATSGAGIGAFVWPVVIDWLEASYGWRGALLVLGALTLNFAVCAAVMRPLPSRSGRGKTSGAELDLPVDIVINACDYDLSETDTIREGSTSPLKGNSDGTPSVAVVGGSLQHINGIDPVNGSMYNTSNGKHPKGSNSLRNIDLSLSGSLHSLHMFAIQDGLASETDLDEVYRQKRVTGDRGLLSADQPPLSEEPHPESDATASAVCTRVCVSVCGYLSILRDVKFLLLITSGSLTNLSYIMPVLYMVDHAVENGIDKHTATVLMSINGAGNLVGRFLLSALSDLACCDAVYLFLTVLTVCGVSTCLSPLAGGEMTLHVVYAAVFGVFMGGYVSLNIVVCVEFMGVAKVDQAYGFLLFFMGTASGVGPPLAGWVHAMTGGFTTPYIVNGSLIVASAVVLLPVAITRATSRR